VNTYFIKVALRGASPMIWRRLRVQGNTSLADLHHIIQIAMGWDNEYLHCFHNTLADAILDRLMHNAHRIKLKGESMRKLQSEID